MTAVLKTKVMALIDAAVIALAGAGWKLITMFDPHPIQHHFAARPSTVNERMTKLFALRDEDAEQSIARICNYHIVSSGRSSSRKGLVGRKGLIKIYNEENGLFLVIRAQGSRSIPGEKGIPKDGIALNYDAKKILGIPKNQEDGLKLIVGPANVNDAEYFYMYFDSDMSSRTARALGWYLMIAGFVYSGWSIAISALGAVTGLFS